MVPIHTILHPTDFSPCSAYAFRLACVLARDHGARLVVLHVVRLATSIYGEGLLPSNPQVLLPEAHEQLNELEVPDASVRAERRLEEGDPATEVLRVAEEIHADLIVLGTHGRTGLERLLMGSVAEQIVRRATCPVVTVKDPLPEVDVDGTSTAVTSRQSTRREALPSCQTDGSKGTW